MKNIFLILTDKLSRLYYNNNEKCFQVSDVLKDSTPLKESQFVYITNEEKISLNNSVYDKYRNVILKAVDKDNIDFFNLTPTRYKKICLTNDPQLINDGVQAIDDEFLEWFLKNLRCENVEVVKEKVDLGDLGHYEQYYNYKIIIPKEETKNHLIKMMQDDEELGLYEETLEEASYNYAKDKKNRTSHLIGFREGVRWVRERSYSEEDMVKFVSFVGKNYIKAKGFYYMKGDFEKRMKVSIHQILEQFKKKQLCQVKK